MTNVFADRDREREAHRRRMAAQGPPLGSRFADWLGSLLAEYGLERPGEVAGVLGSAALQGGQNYLEESIPQIGSPAPPPRRYVPGRGFVDPPPPPSAQLAGPVPESPLGAPPDFMQSPLGPPPGPPTGRIPADFSGMTSGGSHAPAPPPQPPPQMPMAGGVGAPMGGAPPPMPMGGGAPPQMPPPGGTPMGSDYESVPGAADLIRRVQEAMSAQHQQGMQLGGPNAHELARRVQAGMHMQHENIGRQAEMARRTQGVMSAAHNQGVGGGVPPAPPLVPNSPMMAGPQMPIGGEVPEPPMTNHLAAASMMGAFPPERGVNPAAREAMLQIFPPQQSPLGGERPVEDYFSDASLQARMQQAQRHALSQALLGFGSGMLGGDDLSGGLSAGFAGVSGPLAGLQQKREELPLQYAEKRYQLERDRAEDERLAGGERRAEGMYHIAQKQEGRAGRQFEEFDVPRQTDEATLRQRELRQAEIGGYLDQLDKARLQALKTQDNATWAQIKKIDEDIRQGRLFEPYEIAQKVQGVFSLMASADADRARAESYRSGGKQGGTRGLTSGQGMAVYEDALKELTDAGRIRPEWGMEETDAAVLIRMAQRHRGRSEQDLNAIDERLSLITGMMDDIRAGRGEELRTHPMVMADPTLMAIVEQLLNPEPMTP